MNDKDDKYVKFSGDGDQDPYNNERSLLDHDEDDHFHDRENRKDLNISLPPFNKHQQLERRDTLTIVQLADEERKKKQNTLHKDSKSRTRKLWCVMLICIIFMCVEIAGGILAHSLAILTDAAHLLSDVVGVAISIFAIYLGQKDASEEFSYGWARAEILGAIVSVILIWGLTGWLVYEAVLRIITPQHVEGWFMFGTAVFGLFCNIVMASVLHGAGGGHSHGGGGGHGGHGGHSGHGGKPKKKAHEHGDGPGQHNGHGDKKKGHEHGTGPGQHGAHGGKEKSGHAGHDDHGEEKKQKMSINEYAAYIHVIGDLIQSIGVVIASIVIVVWPDYEIVDPITTLLFACLVMATTCGVTKQGMKNLMECTPEGIDLNGLRTGFLSIEGVAGLHELHVWGISDTKIALTVHLVKRTKGVCLDILEEAERVCALHNIGHSVVQIEHPGKFCEQDVHSEW